MSAQTPDNRELLAVVRAWAMTNYPGCPLEYLSIHLRFLPVAIRLADSPSTAVTPQEQPPAQSVDEQRIPEEHGPSLSPVVKAILNTLREVGRPLSRTRLLEEMARRGHDWSDRTVARHLSAMMEDGTLENLSEGNRRGYRLIENATDDS